MEDINFPIFAQAKIEYTKQLLETLFPHIFDGIQSIYTEAKALYATRKSSSTSLLLFRELLEKVPIWNSEIIESETTRIIQSSRCDWIDDLITAVFISHTKILTSIGPNQSFQKINVTIPKTTTFVHKSYINVARELWKNPYLLNEQVPGHEYQRNSKEIEDIIKGCIESTVRNLLPMKEILKEHLDSQDTDSTPLQREDIKQILREEIQQLTQSTKDVSDTKDIPEDDSDEAPDTPETDNSYSKGPVIIKEADVPKDEIEEDLKALSHLAKIAGKPDLTKELKPFKKNNPFIEYYKR